MIKGKSTRKTGLLREVLSRGAQVIIGSPLWDFPVLLLVRNAVLRAMFKCGHGFSAGAGIYFTHPHFEKGRTGDLIVGEEVKINRNVEIDYSGGVTIESHVWISQNVLIETHEHVLSSRPKAEWVVRKKPLRIGDDAWVGANAIILPSVGSIGRGAIIGAGAVVTKPVPDFAVVVGVPSGEGYWR